MRWGEYEAGDQVKVVEGHHSAGQHGVCVGGESLHTDGWSSVPVRWWSTGEVSIIGLEKLELVKTTKTGPVVKKWRFNWNPFKPVRCGLGRVRFGWYAVIGLPGWDWSDELVSRQTVTWRLRMGTLDGPARSKMPEEGK